MDETQGSSSALSSVASWLRALLPTPPQRSRRRVPGMVAVEVSFGGTRHKVPGVCLCRKRRLVLAALHSLGPDVKTGHKVTVHIGDTSASGERCVVPVFARAFACAHTSAMSGGDAGSAVFEAEVSAFNTDPRIDRHPVPKTLVIGVN